MPTKLNPYLHFHDQTRQAMAFYQSVFGGTLTSTTFKDAHMSQDPSDDDRIMHAQLDTDNGLTLMASDAPSSMVDQPVANGSISLSGDNAPELRGYFEQLADGGTVIMPIETAGWGDAFGMCTDKFGTEWLVNIAGKHE
jgi:PhnB protein